MKLSRSIAVRLLSFLIAHQFLVCVYTSEEVENPTVASSWARLQISPNTLTSMVYADFRVNIYEHFNNQKNTTTADQKRYFFAPIGLLDHKSARSTFNNVTRKSEMTFRVQMWNDHVQKEVVNYLTHVGHKVTPYQVQIIPFEQVLLVNKKRSTAYSLSSDWHPYQQERFLLFTLTCFKQISCDELKAIMLTEPEKFRDFKLFFSLSSTTSTTKETVINIKHVVNGKMVSKLLQKYEPEKDPLLTAEDENQLVSEMISNIMVQSFDESEVVSSNSELYISNMVKELLASSKSSISDQNDKIMWSSVFWNDDNYRPDKTSKKLNEIYKKQENETQKKMIDAYKDTNVVGYTAGAGGFTVGANIDLSREKSTSKEELDKLYQESKDHVEWDGEKFVPKPMSLSRVNLANLRNEQKLADRRVNVRYSTVVLSTPLHFTQPNLPNSDLFIELRSFVTDMLIKQNEELDDAKRELEALRKKAKSETEVLEKGISTIRFELEVYKKNAIATTNSAILNVSNKFVAFDAYRTSNFRKTNIVPYAGTNVNVGNGMNITTGIFTAPVAGIYSFEFAGHNAGDKYRGTRAFLQLNGETKTTAHSHTAHTDDSRNPWIPLSCSVTLQLKIGDKVSMVLDEGCLYDTPSEMFTHFSGRLLF